MPRAGGVKKNGFRFKVILDKKQGFVKVISPDCTAM
jgi:hypothetical protein